MFRKTVQNAHNLKYFTRVTYKSSCFCFKVQYLATETSWEGIRKYGKLSSEIK